MIGKRVQARWPSLLGMLFVAGGSLSASAEPTDFQRDVLPLLRKNCIACHNASTAEGDLILETPQQILAGGLSGPAVLPGNGEASPLYRLAAHLDEPTMPPEGNDRNAARLSEDQVAVIKRWIDEGAKGEVIPTAEIVWQPPAVAAKPIYGIAVSPDGRSIAVGRADQITLFDVDLGLVVEKLADPGLPTAAGFGRAGAAHAGFVQAVAFSPDGSRIASGGFQTVKIWQRQAPRPGWRVDISATAVAASPDQRRLALGTADGRIEIADVESGKISGPTLAGHTAPVSRMIFVDQDRLISAAVDGTVRHWRIADGMEMGRIDAGGTVAAIAIVAGRLAIAVDHTITLWPLPETVPSTGDAMQPLAALPEQGTAVTALAALAAGGQLVSATADGNLRLWDVQTGDERAKVAVGGPIIDVAVAKDGDLLLAGTTTGRVTLVRREAPTTLRVVTTQFAEDDSTSSLNRLSFDHDRAKQQTANAKSDLQQATQIRDAERKAVYEAMLEIAKTEIEIGRKQAAVEKPRAAHDAAVAEAAATKKTFDAAEGKAREAAEAALKAAQEKVDKAAKPLETAIAEEAMARQAHEAAKTTVQRIDEAVARAVDLVAVAQQRYDAAKQREKSAADTLALAHRDAEVHGRRLAELEQRAGSLAPPTTASAEPRVSVTVAATKVEAAEMAAMRAAMEAMTLLQQTADSRTMAEGMATEAGAGVDAARKVVDAARKDMDQARHKLEQAADEATKGLRAAELMVAERRVTTAEADLAAAEARQAAVAESAERAVAAATAAKPAAESLRQAAEATLATARGELTDALRQAVEAGSGPSDEPRQRLELWQRQRAREQLANSRRPVITVGFVAGDQEAVWIDTAGRCGRLSVSSGASLGTIVTGQENLRAAAVAEGLILANAAGLSHWQRHPTWKLERQLGKVGDDAIFADRVTAVCFSPDGQLLAVGGGIASRFGQISLWNVISGRPAGVIPEPHSDTVLCLAFSPDGRLIASGAADRAVRLFDLDSQQQRQSFEGHTHHVLGIGWRADGRLLASAAGDGVVKVWDVERGEIHKSLPAFKDAATSLVYLGASDRLVAGCVAGGVQLRDSVGGNAKTFPSDDCLHSVAADRMGRVIAAGGESGVFTVWAADGTLRGAFAPPELPEIGGGTAGR